MNAIQRMQAAVPSVRGESNPHPGAQGARLFSTIQDIYELLPFGRQARSGGQTETALQFRHRRAKAGQAVYRMGQAFDVLYIVRLGFLKTVIRSVDGDARVLSFPAKGDFLGFDGIYRNRYATDAIALTDCELVALPFKQLLTMAHSYRDLEQMIYLAISRELAPGRPESLAGAIRAEARVARFLEKQADSYASLGYSPRNFLLPMSRRDIGSYLGLSLETVSRSLSAMASAGVIAIERRHVQILKPELLHLFRHMHPLPKAKSRHRPREIELAEAGQ
ncbi:transcriptional regulator, Crp/Fnr family [Pollutimonas bauzanensis]|uniref:Transcriptional regulator, Crp/Fnr family n=2 Tax=Pollutimonas bauzanensis TaxID=658167 RepID=A0A1M5MN74_9BURK|nr:transcriptional regulator, Crp/Fnr family [Pollutimonas bauzanensis]